MDVLDVINIVLLVILAGLILIQLYLSKAGIEKVVPRIGSREPFTVLEQTENSLLLDTKIEFANEGKQCATIMDCMVRPQLPYEQYDGIEARGKAELDGAKREDDYFEALLIQKKQSVQVFVKVKLTARKSQDIKEALSQMVDLSLDLVYQHTGRHPWQISKERIVLTAEEIANLAGVTLAKD